MENQGGNVGFPKNLGRPHRNLDENLDQIVERVLNRHGFEVGRNEHPYFVSAFPEYIIQVELPRGAKVPKFLKFAGELNESTVEHIARYLVECGDLGNNEYLKMKYFPSSLTKHAFTWFTNLAPNSINTWARLEGNFHEHFFRGETKVTIVDLMNIKRQNHETLDDYLNRFRQLKSRCYTNIPEHELVKISAIGLDFSIFCKYHNMYGHWTNNCVRFRDMIEKAITEGCLAFKEKDMKVDTDPFAAHIGYVEPVSMGINMVEVNIEEDENVKPISDEKLEELLDDFAKEEEPIYPKEGDSLVKFLSRKKDVDREVMLCPRCSAVFDRAAAKAFEKSEVMKSYKAEKLQEKAKPNTGLTMRQIHMSQYNAPMGKMEMHNSSKFCNTFVSNANVPVGKWNAPPRQMDGMATFEGFRGNRFSIPVPQKGESSQKFMEDDEDMITDCFESGFDDSLEDVCGIVSILPSEYVGAMKSINEQEDIHREDFFDDPSYESKIVWVNQISRVILKFNSAVFDSPTEDMKAHLKPLLLTLMIEGHEVDKGLVDGGATINLLPRTMLKRFGKTVTDLKPHNILISDYAGKSSQPEGMILLDVQIGSVKRTTMFIVTSSKLNFNVLLGREWIHGVGVGFVLSTVHQKIFFWNDDEGLEVLDADQKEGRRGHQENVLLGCEERIFYSSRKRIGSRGRMKYQDPYSSYLARMSAYIADRTAGMAVTDEDNEEMSIKSKECVRSSATTVETKEKEKRNGRVDQEVKNGEYEWVMMPFGLKNAGATYQRTMNLIFHDLIGKFVQVYIDDIIVGSKRKEEHLCHLKLSFERMRKHGLEMSPLKCSFGVTTREFLGFIMHQKGIEVDKNKTKAIMETRSPSNKKELQSLLGKIKFLRRFISNLSGKTKMFFPLLRLKKEEEFRWEEEHQKAFEEIKAYLAHPLVIAPPSKGRQLKLYVSANDSTIAGMLAQDDNNGIERVIYYLSRMLVGVEIRYTPLEKLCLSLYFACTKLKYYLRPFDVLVFCRSNVIKYMLGKPVLNSRIGKWALALTKYSLTSVPLKSTKGQVIADFLVDHSRLTEQVNYLTTKPWESFFDGSKHELGTGIGSLIISPEGIPTKFSLKTKKAYSNNETEYQALITRLEILRELGAKNIIVRGDSQLVINQLTQEYKCVNEKLMECKSRAATLLKSFDEVELGHISRNSNTIANELAQIESGYKINKGCLESIIHIENELIGNLENFTINTLSSIQD
uniref:Retrovirus-related Pol polyprotein from transposon opus n=1 Tax=Cajanus cajan TaxID=3821 RepID=A0A151R7Y7_CAJCA|nr:Retrovirus-related Pol polyprotein from transposon opus [Cajanus cajan]